jgi:hypothetical protein
VEVEEALLLGEKKVKGYHAIHWHQYNTLLYNDVQGLASHSTQK